MPTVPSFSDLQNYRAPREIVQVQGEALLFSAENPNAVSVSLTVNIEYFLQGLMTGTTDLLSGVFV
jgi:hypothetical protein